MSRLKAKGWKRYRENKGKQNGYANFRLRARKVTTYREGYYIMVKESMPPRYSNPKYVCTQQWSYKNMQSKKLIGWKREINKSTVCGENSTPLSSLDATARWSSSFNCLDLCGLFWHQIVLSLSSDIKGMCLFPHQEPIIWYQLGTQQFNSNLTLSTWI